MLKTRIYIGIINKINYSAWLGFAFRDIRFYILVQNKEWKKWFVAGINLELPLLKRFFKKDFHRPFIHSYCGIYPIVPTDLSTPVDDSGVIIN